MQSLNGLHARFHKTLHTHCRMIKYYIPRYVHFALEGDVAVFMNLRLDQYSMLVGTKARAFRMLVSRATESMQGAIHLDTAHVDQESKMLQDQLIAELLSHGLLIDSNIDCDPSLPAELSLPQQHLLEPEAAGGTSVGVREAWHFFVACAIAKWRLSRTSIEHTVGSIQRRKRLHVSRMLWDVDEARRLVRIYNRLRPLIPLDYLCTFDSLSLLEFLARHHCYPNWVFAVQLEPWAAHCWVQYDDIVFNETLEDARTHLPLLSI